MDAVISESTQLETADLTPRIGTQIMADRETLLSGRFAPQIRALLEQRGVLLVRDVQLDDQQQKAFTQTLGKMMVQSGKEVMNISMDRSVNQKVAEYQRGTLFWHID